MSCDFLSVCRKFHQHPVVLLFRMKFNKIQLRYPNVWSLIKINKTIILFALVGYEIGYSQLGATRFVDYLPSHIQRALME